MADETQDDGKITVEQTQRMAELTKTALAEKEPPHPYEHDDALNDRLYNISRKVDKILHREPVENHAAILGMIQVSTGRRMHEHQAKREQAQAAAAEAAQRQRHFGV